MFLKLFKINSLIMKKVGSFIYHTVNKIFLVLRLFKYCSSNFCFCFCFAYAQSINGSFALITRRELAIMKRLILMSLCHVESFCITFHRNFSIKYFGICKLFIFCCHSLSCDIFMESKIFLNS